MANEAKFVDISGLDTVELLRRLWENAKPARFFDSFDAQVAGRTPPGWDEAEARKALKHRKIDYLLGRCIKTDFDSNFINPRLYDRDWGVGKFQSIADQLRKDAAKTS